MQTKLTRRQFLKLATMLSLSSLTAGRRLADQSGRPKVLIVVFDAWTASNTSLYGYPRQTMPHLEALAERAVVYHRHYAAGPWTVPGAASLLTGTYPWTHRAFTAAEMQVVNPQNNLFARFRQAGYRTVAATHNMYADDLLTQFGRGLDSHPHFNQLFLPTRFPFTRLFPRDLEAGALAQLRAFWDPDNIQSSIFLGRFLKSNAQADIARIDAQYGDLFPRGVPEIPVVDLRFLLEDGIDHLLDAAAGWLEPTLGYYHFYPPHQPYNTRREFIDLFQNDGVVFPKKPESVISEGHSQQRMDAARQEYDEFLRYVDAEFYRLYQTMDASGQLEDTWIVLTSDHGELFERGNIGHEHPGGYEAEVRIPLLIFPPGQQNRVDVHSPTSAVDILPTLLHVAGLPAVGWTEGSILPPFSSGELPPERSVFVFHPSRARARRPIRQGAATIVKGNLKLVSTFGIRELEGEDPMIEMFDLAADPEELVNIYDPANDAGKDLLQELRDRILAADAPYQ